MKPPEKQSAGRLFVLNAYWLGLSVMWNSLHVIILPAVLIHLAPDALKNTYLGLLTFGGLIIAMIVQPVAGSFSDRWVSRWGRRRPLMALGTGFDFLFLALLGWAGGIPWLVLGYIGLQFSSNIAHGPAQGLLPDRVPPEQLGTASAVKNLLDMLGLVFASLVMGRMVDPNSLHPVLPMALIAAVLAAGAAVTLLGVREQPSLPGDHPSPSKEEKRTKRVGLRSLLVDLKQNSSFTWLIASRFAFLVGIYDIQVFAQYYVRDVLQVENPIQLTGDLLAVLTLTLIVFALGGGWLGDRVGHERMLVAAGLVGAVGCALLLLARTPLTLLLTGSVLGMGIGLFLTSNWALANRLAPPGEAGKFLGLTNLATAGSGAVARLGGPLIDILNNAQPGAFWGYSGMFIFGAFCSLASILLLLPILARRWRRSDSESMVQQR